MPQNIEKFEMFKYPLDTGKGVIYYSFWFIALLGVLYTTFDKIFLPLYYCWSFLFLSFLIYWLIRRFNYNYFSNKLLVIFAVTINDFKDEKLLRLYNNLIDNFKEKLKDYDLSKNIIIKKKPVDINFSDNSAAESKTKLNMPCSTLIISGLHITGGKEVEFKFNFHYEFRHPAGKDKEQIYKEIFGKKVAKSLAGKNWRV